MAERKVLTLEDEKFIKKYYYYPDNNSYKCFTANYISKEKNYKIIIYFNFRNTDFLTQPIKYVGSLSLVINFNNEYYSYFIYIDENRNVIKTTEINKSANDKEIAAIDLITFVKNIKKQVTIKNESFNVGIVLDEFLQMTTQNDLENILLPEVDITNHTDNSALEIYQMRIDEKRIKVVEQYQGYKYIFTYNDDGEEERIHQAIYEDDEGKKVIVDFDYTHDELYLVHKSYKIGEREYYELTTIYKGNICEVRTYMKHTDAEWKEILLERTDEFFNIYPKYSSFTTISNRRKLYLQAINNVFDDIINEQGIKHVINDMVFVNKESRHNDLLSYQEYLQKYNHDNEIISRSLKRLNNPNYND